jgi:hypothetical protein
MGGARVAPTLLFSACAAARVEAAHQGRSGVAPRRKRHRLELPG